MMGKKKDTSLFEFVSLITTDNEHLFICSFNACISFVSFKGTFYKLLPLSSLVGSAGG